MTLGGLHLVQPWHSGAMEVCCVTYDLLLSEQEQWRLPEAVASPGRPPRRK